MNYGRFTELHILRKIGRPVWRDFFAHFDAEMAAKGVPQLEESLSDDDYLELLRYRFMGPEGLPDRVNEVMHAVHEMATPDGHERLKEAIMVNCPELPSNGDTTPEELALRVWMHAPALLARKYNEQKLRRLSRFDYYQGKSNPFAWGEQSMGSKRKDDVLVGRLDAWCLANDRGAETVVVEKYDLSGEEWYLIRHGDTYLRSAKVEKRKVEALHYRPAKDDVVVYSPERDELRINAKTKGEKELYREAFGFYLKGFGGCFEETRTYTLEPLRIRMQAALDCEDVPGFKKVVLTRLEVDMGNGYGQGCVLKADDIFACSWNPDTIGVSIPQNAKLKGAAFQIELEGYEKPLELHIKPPNILKMGQHAAAPKVHEWLVAREFKKRGGESVAANAA